MSDGVTRHGAGKNTARVRVAMIGAGDMANNVHYPSLASFDELFVFGGFQAKSREFIDCVKRGGQPGSHFGDAVKSMEVVERILAQSLMEGR